MPVQLRKRFGTHVRALRQGRKFTQEVLAERADLSVDAIRRIERGAFSPSLDTLGKLAAGLDISLPTLFQGFDKDKRDHNAELCDYLTGRSRAELQVAWRVLRAIFEEQ